MNNLLARIKPYWAVSFQCSKSYKIVITLLTILFFSGYVIMTHTMFRTEHPHLLPILLLRGFTDTLLFIGISHFLIRPYLKLYFLPQSRFGWNVLHFAIYTFALSALVVFISMQIARFSPFGDINFSNVTVQDPEKTKANLTLNMSKPAIILMGTINQSILYWMWTLAYVFWHTLISKKQIQRQMHEAHMQQLTNQLNPHFLFNALNSIRALIFEDQEKAAHTLTQLSELFRVHLQSHLKPVSTFEDEWQIAKRYLEIEQVRLEDRLQLVLNFDNSLWQQSLPTLSILTLAENAIKHGISPSNKTGFLEIISKRIDTDHWQLCVNNSVDGDSAEKSTHTGLTNLQQRLQLLSPRHQLHYRKTVTHFELRLELVDDKNLNR